MNKVEVAIKNIFKEEGRAVTDITVDTITVDRFKEVTYNYTVQDDTIIITNKLGSTVYEKSIRSYQDLNISVTID